MGRVFMMNKRKEKFDIKKGIDEFLSRYQHKYVYVYKSSNSGALDLDFHRVEDVVDSWSGIKFIYAISGSNHALYEFNGEKGFFIAGVRKDVSNDCYVDLARNELNIPGVADIGYGKMYYTVFYE